MPPEPLPPSHAAPPTLEPGIARTAPATGAADPARTELTPEEEPTTTGTLFLTLILLMVIGGIWAIVYQRLLTR